MPELLKIGEVVGAENEIVYTRGLPPAPGRVARMEVVVRFDPGFKMYYLELRCLVERAALTLVGVCSTLDEARDRADRVVIW